MILKYIKSGSLYTIGQYYIAAGCKPVIDDSGHIIISDLEIIINKDAIINYITENILSADLVIDRMLNETILHEIGRLIDCISYNGMTEEEYKEIIKHDKEEFRDYGEYFVKCFKEICKDFPEDKDFSLMYGLAMIKFHHTTGDGRKADENVGLTWKDFYETEILIHETNKKRKSITFELE